MIWMIVLAALIIKRGQTALYVSPKKERQKTKAAIDEQRI
jgi:hypothetical protein